MGASEPFDIEIPNISNESDYEREINLDDESKRDNLNSRFFSEYETPIRPIKRSKSKPPSAIIHFIPNKKNNNNNDNDNNNPYNTQYNNNPYNDDSYFNNNTNYPKRNPYNTDYPNNNNPFDINIDNNNNDYPNNNNENEDNDEDIPDFIITMPENPQPQIPPKRKKKRK